MVNRLDFEQQIGQWLNKRFPQSVLSNVCLFKPANFGLDKEKTDEFHGYEIDHLLHYRAGSKDHLVIIECKNNIVKIKGSSVNMSPDRAAWWVGYGEEEKSVKKQIRNQSESLFQNYQLRSIPRIGIEGIVLSSENGTPNLKDNSPEYDGLVIHLIGKHKFQNDFNKPQFLKELFNAENEGSFLRIEQSNILRKIRQGLIIEELGHPEVPNAIEYIKRCRKVLDARLFSEFEPTNRRWAINGSAGMGKTVLLAYGAVAVGAGKSIFESKDQHSGKITRHLQDIDEESMGLPKWGNRSIVVTAKQQKHVEILESTYREFEQIFRNLANDDIRIRGSVP